MREISSLLNAEVISSKEGKRLGAIAQVVVDLAQGKLLGLILGKGPAEKGLAAKDIKVLGPDVVMVEDSAVAKRLSEVPALLAARRDPTRAPQQVVTDSGQRLGRLGRIYLDSEKLTVTHFEISGGAWRDLTEGVLALPVIPGIIHGPDTIIVPAAGLAQALESSGLAASVEKAAEQVREGGKTLGKIVETGAESLLKSLENQKPIVKVPRAKAPVKSAASTSAPDKAAAAPAKRKPAAPKSKAAARPAASAAKKSTAGRKPKSPKP